MCDIKQANFFRNIGTILTFAFAGTFISAIVLGLILYLWTRIPLDGLNISFVEAISVGATLSATDPVTILAIFNLYKVEPKLYTIIFGESILNDAVAIVLFETAQKYAENDAAKLTILNLFEAIGLFLLVFFGSMLVGILVGIGTALVLKYTHVRRMPKIESCLIVLIAYATYFFSNGVYLSGEWARKRREVDLVANRTRYRLTVVLRNNPEALCILQHVSEDAAHHQVPLPSHGTTERELHLHLFGPGPPRREGPQVQASFRHRHCHWHLRCSIPLCFSPVQGS